MKATETFRTAPYRHNCAQAIAYKWHKLYADKDIVEHYAPYVGGRAPEGYCGALYAAMQACQERAEEIKSEFCAVCGATHCSDIKRNCHTPCEMCVETADKLVEKFSAM